MYSKRKRRSALMASLLTLRTFTMSTILFVCCLGAGTEGFTQSTDSLLVLSSKSKHRTTQLSQCEHPYLFLSDTLSTTYNDRHPRNSVYTICPQYPQQRVRVVFESFDLRPEDTLLVLNGFEVDAPLLAKATGTGREAAFGGEIISPYSREENPTSCLTFLFRTNGDEIAGTGWVATAQCVERTLTITIPHIPPQQFVCGPSFSTVNIAPATVFSLSGPIDNDSTLVIIRDGLTGAICQQAILSLSANSSFSSSFGIGMYVVEYISLLDPAIKGSTRFEVIAPILKCTTAPAINLGPNCELPLSLEQLVDQYCPPENGVFHYNLIVKDLQDKVVLHGTTLEELPFVIAPNSICSNDSYSVEIQKEYSGATLGCSSSRLVQTCATTIAIDNQFLPQFEESPQIYTANTCEINLSEILNLLPVPTVTSRCGNVTVQIESTSVLNHTINCQEVSNYLVTWKATDNCGRIVRRSDSLQIMRPIIVEAGSSETISRFCEEHEEQTIAPLAPPTLLTGVTIKGQFQPINSFALSTSRVVCNYELTLEESSQSDKCNRTLLRYWSLRDLCNPSVTIPVLDTQTIQIIDTLAPTIQCTEHTTLLDAEEIILPANSCQMTLNFPLPRAIDNCNDMPIVKAFTFEILVNREWSTEAISLLQTGIGVGTYRIGYEAASDCDTNNPSICFRYFTIKDTTAPTANCNTALSIQLADNGTASLTATELNTNSIDNCGIAQLSIRRSICQTQGPAEAPEAPIRFGAYANQVSFDCCDIGNPVQVELLVTDAAGNSNTCSVQVQPTFVNTQNTFSFNEVATTYTLTACDFDLGQIIRLLPVPGVTGICGGSSAQLEQTIILTDNIRCENQADFLIVWQAADAAGNIIRRTDTLRTTRPTPIQNTNNQSITLFCQRAIDTLSNLSYQPPSLITGITINGQFQALDTLSLSTAATICDFELTQELEGSATTCNESIQRIWRIRDLCAINPSAVPIDTQQVTLIDTIPPIIDCSNFATVEEAEIVPLPADACLRAVSLPLPAVTDNCDTQPIVREATVETLVNGVWTTIATTLASISYGRGTYRVGYTAIDNCQNSINQGDCYRYFRVVDNTDPIPFCRANIIVQLEENGTAVLSAETVNNNSSDNCGIAEITIRRSLCMEEQPAESGSEEIQFGDFSNQVLFDCCDVGEIVQIEMNVRDEVGNNSTCRTQVTQIEAEDTDAFTFVDTSQIYTLMACEFDLLSIISMLPTPAVIGICGESSAQLETTTILTDNTRCDDQSDFLITWQATNDLGDTIRRMDTLKINRPSVFQTRPSEPITLICTELLTNPSFAPIDPPSLRTTLTIGGQVSILDSVTLSLTEPVCDYQLQVAVDTSAINCDNPINRIWSVIDLCADTSMPIGIDTQRIQLIDTLAPVIRCSEFNSIENAQTIALPADDCQTTVTIPLPSATDNCDDNPIVREFTVEQLEDATWVTIGTSLNDLPVGPDTFRVGYEALDNCGANSNRSICYHFFTVIDTISPIANCQTDLRIELDEMGKATLDATALNNNSFDNCGIKLLLTKRSACELGNQRIPPSTDTIPGVDLSKWFPSIEFECCDLAGEVTLDLLVVDSFNNSSTCQTTTQVIDPISPSCSLLPPATATCQMYEVTDFGRPTDRDEDNEFDEAEWLPISPNQVGIFNTRFGNALSACSDNATCSRPTIEQEYQLIEGLCGSINIKRRYRAIDAAGNPSAWLEQSITITYQPDWTLVLPADAMTNCEVTKIEDPKNPIQNGTCDDLVWNFRDSLILFENGSIKEICRTFNIVNRCFINNTDEQWEPIPRPENEQGVVLNPVIIPASDYAAEDHLTYVQKIRLIDNDAPFLVLGEVDRLIRGKGDALPLGEEDQVLGEAPFECDEIKEFTVFARDCNEPSTLAISYNWEFFRNERLVAEGTGNTFQQIVLPDSIYTVHWSAVDDFNNQSDTTATYQFIDGTPPTTICREELEVIVDGTTLDVIITTDSLNEGTFDNCNDQLDLNLFLWYDSMMIDTPSSLAAINQLPDSILFSCADVGQVEVLLFSTDQSGNFSSCSTTINIIENTEINCDETMLSGTIFNRIGAPIKGASVAISGMEKDLTITSDEAGKYQQMLPTQRSYTIRPHFHKHPLNGVSTYDLILLNKYILGVESFDSPYQYIAADINKSGHITIFDAVQLRRLILNKTATFPNNDSWRFVDAKYEFQTSQPLSEPFPESYNYEATTAEHLTNMDFIGVKIGDISGDADTYNLGKDFHSQSRNAGTTFSIYTKSLKVEKGKTYQIPVYSPDLKNILGLQATFKFHDLILTNFTGGIVTSEQTHGWQKKQEGFLTISCSSLLSHENYSSRLFTLTVKATKDGLLEELLTLTSNPTPTEAYALSGNRLGLMLNFTSLPPKESLHSGPVTALRSASKVPVSASISSASGTFQVFQNHPNPFSETTTISFHLPKAAITALRVFDIHGQNISQTQQYYELGTHTILLNSDQFTNGTYFYQVATPFGVATQKMIVNK